MTHRKTYNKSPRKINHKATKCKTNTGTTALERSVEQTTGEFKALLQLANFTLGPDAQIPAYNYFLFFYCEYTLKLNLSYKCMFLIDFK